MAASKLDQLQPLDTHLSAWELGKELFGKYSVGKEIYPRIENYFLKRKLALNIKN